VRWGDALPLAICVLLFLAAWIGGRRARGTAMPVK
jgi:hypothetical protein